MSLTTYKRVLLTILSNMSLKELNTFFNDWLVYNKVGKVSKTFILKFKDFYIFDFDTLKYNKYTSKQFEEFIKEFVNSLEYEEDFELIFNYIL